MSRSISEKLVNRKVLFIWPITAQCSPAQNASQCARGANPRTRPQPGPGPGKLCPAWAKSGPHTRGTTATVRSRSTVAR
jgi:hypothetical protein